MSVERSHPRVGSSTNANGVLRDNPRLSYDPRNIDADLLVWVRADLGTTMNGATVSAWADYSGGGNGFAQGTASAQPALNTSGAGGRPELSFDGSNDTLAGSVNLYADLSYGADVTVVVVFGSGWTGTGLAAPNWYQGRALWSTGGTGYPQFGAGGLTEGSGDCSLSYGGLWTGSAYGQVITAADAVPEGEPGIFVCVLDDGDGYARLNGVQTSTASPLGSGTMGGASTSFYLAAGSGTLSAQWEHFDGPISEVLIFDGALDEEEIEALESYLGDRYGIGV